MAANKQRANAFNSNILELEEQLSFDELYDTFKAKLLDRLARKEIDADSLRGFIRQIEGLLNADFVPFVQQSYDAYNEIITLANTHYNDIGEDIFRELPRIQTIEKVNLTRLGDYKDDVVRDISKKVRANLFAGNSFDELAKDLAKIDGRVKSFANTLARTQVKAYGQLGKTEKARLGEVFFFEYIGIRRAETRRFCTELLNLADPTFHINDIRQMKNAQVGNVLYYRGGFNCHHDWEPDPFFKSEGYSASFFEVNDGGRSLKIGRR